MAAFGKLLVVVGLVTVSVGLLLQLGDRVPWLGRLPGDILIKRDHSTFYFPLTTSVLVSVIVSALLYLFRR